MLDATRDHRPGVRPQHANQETSCKRNQPDASTRDLTLRPLLLRPAPTRGVTVRPKRPITDQRPDPQPDPESGEDIVALRRFIGLTQAQFAQPMAISVHTLRNWSRAADTPMGQRLRCSESPRVILASFARILSLPPDPLSIKPLEGSTLLHCTGDATCLPHPLSRCARRPAPRLPQELSCSPGFTPLKRRSVGRH
jgi:hypothetical protein